MAKCTARQIEEDVGQLTTPFQGNLTATLVVAKGLVCVWVCVWVCVCVCVFLTTHLFDCMSKVCAGLHCILQRFLLETNWPQALTTPLMFGEIAKNTHQEKTQK